METCLSLHVFFPAVIPFTDDSTNSCSSLVPKKVDRLGQQEEGVTASAAGGTCNDLLSNQLQLVHQNHMFPVPQNQALWFVTSH